MSDDSDNGDYSEEEDRDFDNSASEVYASEYTSILSAFFNHAIGPVLKNKPVNRELLEKAISELDCKISTKEFKSLPFRVRDAYLRFRNFAGIVDKADDSEIRYQSEIFEGLSPLIKKCSSSENEVTYAGGRDLCREEKYLALATISEVETYLGRTQLVLAAKTMVDICRLCPHK
ncbi:MAG: hypothetical protein WC979_06180 [Candidatus Pacearchaeota archaeon]|jgi:hypothetical protein